MRDEHSHERVDRGDENRQKVCEPAKLAGNGRRRFVHVTCYEGGRDRSAKPEPMEELPRVVDSQRLFEGRVFGVRTDRIRYADGAEHRVDVVEHGVSLAIVATPSRDEVVLVRQYRHPAGAMLWEIPAGTAESGETPVGGARRELREETGFMAGRMVPIGSFWMTPGFCSELMHFFHAEDLTAGEPAFDDDERIEVGVFTIRAAWRLAASGNADVKTVLALLWLQGGEDKIGSEFGR